MGNNNAILEIESSEPIVQYGILNQRLTIEEVDDEETTYSHQTLGIGTVNVI
jgi:hypothetical protein